jgi:hypothetical protein
MLERIRRVDNPLTIIAIFAGITEVAAATALPFLTAEVQATFVWFLTIFPFVLVSAFFLTLNFNPKVLYAPGDYRDDKHFLQALQISGDTVEVSVTKPDAPVPKIEQRPSSGTGTTSQSAFDGITRREVDAANAFMGAFHPLAKDLLESRLIEQWSFGVHGEGLFLLSVAIKARKGQSQPLLESDIIRSRELPNNEVELSVVGHPIKSTDPKEFAEIVFQSIQNTVNRYHS